MIALRQMNAPLRKSSEIVMNHSAFHSCNSMYRNMHPLARPFLRFQQLFSPYGFIHKTQLIGADIRRDALA